MASSFLKPKRSLRTVLILWILLLAFIPLMFITGYSIVKFEQAVDNELIQRLRSNSREVATTLGEFERYLDGRRGKLRSDPQLIVHLASGDIAAIKAILPQFLRGSLISSISVFDRDAQLVANFNAIQLQLTGTEAIAKTPTPPVYLSEVYRSALERQGQVSVADVGAKSTLELISLTRIETKTHRQAGAIEETINLGTAFVDNLKKRLGLEVMLLDSRAQVVAMSQPEPFQFNKEAFVSLINSKDEALFDYAIKGEPMGWIVSKIKWGDSFFYVGLAASKKKSKEILRSVTAAFLTILCVIGALLLVAAYVISKSMLRPLNELVAASQNIEGRLKLQKVPVTADNEIGVLTESFNQMAERVFSAREELERKIQELEKANREIRETQARLVHSAKMASLGQLVAGVAHELNNPIGFVYSNMATLKDYIEKLKQIVENPQKNDELKKEFDFDFIMSDLPKLISSSEDGARRMRDIVIKLRNFSRLDEAKFKAVDLREGIESTLVLLQGELKGKVKVHLDLEPVPAVLCSASQLNQVFMNLLSNAAQAIEKQGDIWIELKEKSSTEVEIVIRDSGKGIRPDDLTHIFDPFFTTKEVGQGTGLGLSISYEIIKKHGGEIVVSSQVGKGTTFKITLPIAKATAQ